jgi:integrase
MGQKRPSGLTKRGGVWHLDKQIGGTRLRGSTGTSDLVRAQEFLAKRVDETREARTFGVREDRSFRAAATKYLAENQHKRRITDDALELKRLDGHIGPLAVRHVHMGTLRKFIEQRQKDGVRTRTINASLGIVRRVLNLAATEWIDEQGLTWLERAPKIKLLPVRDARAPYPLSTEEQALLFRQLPDHLTRMALFKVNTGCREQEVCGLKWDYEVKVPELDTSVFLIPSEYVKNGEERLVVLNRVAKSVIEAQRGQHPAFVFVHGKGENRKPVTKMNNTAWKRARERAAEQWLELKGEPAADGYRRVRVHDLKHTFGRRLRAAGVSFEDRQDLLGHRSGRITTHYSGAELANLIAAADKACDENPHKVPTTTWLRRKVS